MTKRCAGRGSTAWRSAAAAAALGGAVLLPLLAGPAAAQVESTASCVERCANQGECAPNPFTACLPHVYRTDEPAGSENPPYDDFIQLLPGEGTATLRLFITADGTDTAGPDDGSGDVGTPCLAGPPGLYSDHLCSFTVMLVIPDVCENWNASTRTCVNPDPEISPGQFVSFTPNPALVAQGGLVTVPTAIGPGPTIFDPGQTSFGINFVNPLDPLAPGPPSNREESAILLGELEVEVLEGRIVVWVQEGDAVRSALAKAVDTGSGLTIANVDEEEMSAHALAVPEPGSWLSLASLVAGLAALQRLRRGRR